MCTDPRESVCVCFMALSHDYNVRYNCKHMWAISIRCDEIIAWKRARERGRGRERAREQTAPPPTFLRSLSAASWEVGGHREEINAIRHRSIVSKSRRHERLPATGIPSDQKAGEKVDGIPRIHHLDFLSNQAFYRNHLAMINSLARRCLPSTLWNGIKCSK